MTCPHCGFLMSPLDADCARCRHRGYVPPAAPPVAPTPAYSYAPILPAPSQPQPSRALEVMACLMSVTALLGLVLFGLILHQRRNARQQAEIAALRQQLAETQQSQTYTTVANGDDAASNHPCRSSLPGLPCLRAGVPDVRCLCRTCTSSSGIYRAAAAATTAANGGHAANARGQHRAHERQHAADARPDAKRTAGIAAACPRSARPVQSIRAFLKNFHSPHLTPSPCCATRQGRGFFVQWRMCEIGKFDSLYLQNCGTIFY